MKHYLLVAAFLLSSMLLFAGAGDAKETRERSKKQGWLGVSIQDVTPAFAREHDLKIKEGAYVNEIVDESPADSAGLKEGDVINDMNGKKIETAEDLTDAIRATSPGTKVTVKVNRNGENKSIGVNIGKNKTRSSFAVTASSAPRIMMNFSGGGVEGMEVMELNKQLGEYFEAPNGKGVLVKNVEKEENAAKAGIKAGDVITKIGDETIKDVEDVHDAISDLSEGDKVNIELLRKGKKTTVSLEVSEKKEQSDHIFWREQFPGNFNFHFEPQMDQMQKEIEMRMRELPRKQNEMKKIEMKIKQKTGEV